VAKNRANLFNGGNISGVNNSVDHRERLDADAAVYPVVSDASGSVSTSAGGE
jgi:hypothetical protein